jgi:ABC-type transport system involved in multi-copper enzyme maturation permease subunit
MLHRLRAVMRFELLMQRRRPFVPMLFVFILVMLSIVLITQRYPVRFQSGDPFKVTVTENHDLSSEDVTEQAIILMIVLCMGLGWAVPLFMADMVAKDYHHRVLPVLSSTPLTPGTYLAGKVLTAWGILAAGLLSVTLLVGAEVRLLFGPFDEVTYTQASAAGIISVLFLSGLSVFLGATQSDRRRAILLCAVGINLLNVVMLLTLAGTTRDAILGNAGVFFLHFAVGLPGFDATSPYSTGECILTVVSMLVQLALIWIVLWWWLRERYVRE